MSFQPYPPTVPEAKKKEGISESSSEEEQPKADQQQKEAVEEMLDLIQCEKCGEIHDGDGNMQHLTCAICNLVVYVKDPSTAMPVGWIASLFVTAGSGSGLNSIGVCPKHTRAERMKLVQERLRAIINELPSSTLANLQAESMAFKLIEAVDLLKL